MTSPRRPLLDDLRRHATDRPNAAAVIDDARCLSYADLYAATAERSRLLTSTGEAPGSRVVLLTTNAADTVINVLAIAAAGGSPLLIDERAPAAEQERINAAFRPAMMVRPKWEVTPIGTHEPGESFLCLPTSGSTGVPKLVALDWRATAETAQQFGMAYGLGSDDVVLVTTPIGHSYGLCVGIIGPLCHGSTIVLSRHPFTQRSLIGLVQRHRVTVVQSVPFYYKLLVDCPVQALAGVRTCISAGDALPDALWEQWTTSHSARLCNHYGATEVGQVSIEHDGATPGVGRPIAGCTVDVVPSDESARGGAPGEMSGRIRVRAAGAPCRYLGMIADGDPSRHEGWFETGDFGYMNADGRLMLTGRAMNRINVAGRKVDPSEVEHAIRAIPGVADCAVVGRASTSSSDTVWAFIEGVVDERHVRRILRESLSDFKVPSVIRQIDAIPRTTSGKIRYGLLPS